ncbi:hypothetical protein ScPMuIL_017605 [Solemya velum]
MCNNRHQSCVSLCNIRHQSMYNKNRVYLYVTSVTNICVTFVTNLCDTIVTSLCDTFVTNLCDTFVTDLCDTFDIDLCDTFVTDLCDTFVTDLCDTFDIDLCDTFVTDLCDTFVTNLCDTFVTNLCDTFVTDLCDTFVTDLCDTFDIDLCDTFVTDLCDTLVTDLCDTFDIDLCDTFVTDLCDTFVTNQCVTLFTKRVYLCVTFVTNLCLTFVTNLCVTLVTNLCVTLVTNLCVTFVTNQCDTFVTNKCDTFVTNKCDTFITNKCDTFITNLCVTFVTNQCDTFVTNKCDTFVPILCVKCVQNALGSEGLPVAVQCVGLPFHDELVLRLMKEVETNLVPVDSYRQSNVETQSLEQRAEATADNIARCGSIQTALTANASVYTSERAYTVIPSKPVTFPFRLSRLPHHGTKGQDKYGVTAIYETLGPMVKFTINMSASEKIAQVASKREAAFQKLKDKLHGLTSADPEVKQIIDLKFTELRDKLQKGVLKPTEVLRAYQVKALEVNKDLNCVTEPVLEAEATAQALDNLQSKKGLLHGIPISVKENVELKGYAATTGLCCRLDAVAEVDAKMIQVLKEEGAVPFMRTNLPQTMMTLECSNPLYGVTSNPYDHTRGPGGSTGGEGALIGGRGSILGIGNDLGGSGRIPAAFCGVCSLKPTSGRISNHGTWGASIGQNIIAGINGPFGDDVDALVMCMKTLLGANSFTRDRYLVPIAFRDEIYEKRKPLTIGYSYSDGHKAIAESCVRAVSDTKAALERAGHKLVPFVPPRVGHSMALWSDACFGDNCASLVSVLEGDVVDPSMQKAYKFMKDYRLDEDKSMAEMGYVSEYLSLYLLLSFEIFQTVTDWWKLNVQFAKYKEEFFNAWRGANLDVLIYPAFAYPAFPKGMLDEIIGGISYAAVWNVVDYPAGILPVTKVTADDVQKTMSMEEKGVYEKFLKKATVGSEGLPVAVQCVGLPYDEELVLQLMKEIEREMKFEKL